MRGDSDHLMDIHGAVEVVLRHFYESERLARDNRRPIEAYGLVRTLNYEICRVWSRFEARGQELSVRELIILAEAWLMAAHIAGSGHMKPIGSKGGWREDCSRCDKRFFVHRNHPENTPRGPDRFLCADGNLYEPKEYGEW